MEKTIRINVGRKGGRKEGRKEGKNAWTYLVISRRGQGKNVVRGTGGGCIVKCRTDGRTSSKHGTYVFHPTPIPSPASPRLGFHVAISYPTNPEVLEGSDLSRAPVPDWSTSIFSTPRPTRPPPSRRRRPYAPAIHLGGVGGSVVLSRLVWYHSLPTVSVTPPPSCSPQKHTHIRTFIIKTRTSSNTHIFITT